MTRLFRTIGFRQDHSRVIWNKDGNVILELTNTLNLVIVENLVNVVVESK